MDFLGQDIETQEGAAIAHHEHRRLLREYLKTLDKYRTLPACEDLSYSDLVGKGFSKDFLNSLETLTCLPPPGDSLYQDEDSPFELQYQEFLDRMDKDPDECEKQDREFFETLSDEEKTLSQAMSMLTSLTNTFFMLSIDWAQVGIIGNLPCQPSEQMMILGLLSSAAGACRTAFDRIHMHLQECAIQQVESAIIYAGRTKLFFKAWIFKQPKFADALNTRIQVLNQSLGGLEKLANYLKGNTSVLE